MYAFAYGMQQFPKFKLCSTVAFIGMKEDAMKNGQLKPGYNIQVGNENTFAIGYDIFAEPADMRTLPVHIDNVQKRLEHTFEMVIADTGYGTEKVMVEIGLLLMGYNIKNLMRKEQEKEAA